MVEFITRKHINMPVHQLADYVSGSLAIFNFAGEPVLAKWTDMYKRKIYESRINTTRAIVTAIKQCQHKPEMFFNASAVGIYDSYEVHDEFSTNFANNFLSSVCIDWEKEAFKLCNMQSTRVIIGRLGIVLGKEGGAFPRFATQFKLGMGGRIGDGYQCIPFIHIDDLLAIMWFFLKNRNCKGIYNIVAPQMVSNREFAQQLAKALHRPNIMVVPEFMLRLIYKDAASMLADGQKVTPKRLKENMFPFQYPTLDQAIKSLI